jgi:hypothetical protein
MMKQQIKSWLIVIAIVHACFVTIKAQGEQTNAAAPLGVISGRVTVVSGDLPPNTTVFVSTMGIGAPPRSAVVNSDGTFKVEGLDTGLYRVWTNAPGYIPDTSQSTPDNRGIYHTGDSVDLKLRKGGVITGTVMGGNNAAVVNVNVRAFRVKDENGKPAESNTLARERLTDDRGVYRMYGMAPGTYIVSAGGTSRIAMTMRGGAYDTDVPTYAPSSTRDTASEVLLRAGEEVTADIQYRGEPGHAISGSISGVVSNTSGTLIFGGGTVALIDVKSRTMVTETQAPMTNNYAFAFYGIPDGEYELSAQQFTAGRDIRGSEPKRLKVQGADLTGISLTMNAMPAITGRVILDRNTRADCVKRRESALQETLIGARRQKSAAKTGDAKSAPAADLIPMQFTEQYSESVPDDKGDFTLRNLHAGTYRLNLQPPSAAWYVRSIALGANMRTSDPTVISEGITLKSQTVSGLTVTISEGAAGIRGRVVAGENQQLSSRTMVYVVPAEKENANDLLRFLEARVASDSRFTIGNVPPGDYFLVALASEDDRPAGYLIREDATLRGRVVRDAEGLKLKITLKPCQHIDDYELSYSSATKP